PNADGTLTLDGVLTDRSELKLPAELEGKKLTAIGVGAFAGLKELKAITLPAGVVSIGANAFSGCEWLKRATLPDTLLSIGSHAFSGCRSLDGVLLPKGLTTLGSGAFSGCATLSAIALPDAIDYLGDRVFSGCSSLASVSFGSVSYIGVGLFENCSSLQKAEIPACVTSIGEYAFRGCRALETATLPAGLETLGEYAFADCSSLRSVELPAALKSLGAKAFDGCVSLERISVSPQNLHYTDDDGAALYTANRRELILCAPGTGEAEYTAAATTEMIDPCAFAYNPTLRKVTLPASIFDIGADAFFGCSALEEIVMPDGKNCRVRDGALYTSYADYTGNLRVTLVCLPAACGKTEFTIPADVNAIAEHALTGALGVEKYAVDPQNTSFKADSVGALYDFEKTELIAYPPASEKTVFELPSNVRTVRPDAFYGSGNLTAVTARSMYYKDKDGVLLTGDKLTLVVYPGGRADAAYALPANLQYIADGAFSGVRNIAKLTLPVSLVSIGEGSFWGASFDRAEYAGSRDAWENVEIGRRNEALTENLTFAVADEEPADLVPIHPEPEYLLGDVNGDGKVNSTDARLVLRVSAKLETLDETQQKAADVNADTRINSSDARLILRVAAKLQSF
ncbi:MAG: leucine-rich repeat protein, partial [Clostridia bacterium]|nr:leucine-rich repeat protein [Clostridia bacterium]